MKSSRYPPRFVLRHAFVLLVLGALCAAIAWGVSTFGARGPRSTLATAPAGSTFVAEIDADALRRSPLWSALGDGEGGLDRVAHACGFDPLAGVRKVVVFATGEQAFEHLGFVARGDLQRERLVECVQHVVEEGGGGVQRVEIEGEPAMASARGSGRAAFLGGDGIVGGDEETVAAALRVQHGDQPGADGDEPLARLWQRVGAQHLVAVFRLPSGWREALDGAARRVGITGAGTVQTIGAGATLREGLALTLALEATGAGEAAALAESALRRVQSITSDPLMSFVPMVGVLRSLRVEHEGPLAIARIQLDDRRLEEVVAMGRAWLAQKRSGALALPAPAADEQLRASP